MFSSVTHILTSAKFYYFFNFYFGYLWNILEGIRHNFINIGVTCLFANIEKNPFRYSNRNVL